MVVLCVSLSVCVCLCVCVCVCVCAHVYVFCGRESCNALSFMCVFHSRTALHEFVENVHVEIT